MLIVFGLLYTCKHLNCTMRSCLRFHCTHAHPVRWCNTVGETALFIPQLSVYAWKKGERVNACRQYFIQMYGKGGIGNLNLISYMRQQKLSFQRPLRHPFCMKYCLYALAFSPFFHGWTDWKCRFSDCVAVNCCSYLNQINKVSHNLGKTIII